jgi:hypothetical protein
MENTNMARLRLIGLMLLALTAFGALGASAAIAEEGFLPLKAKKATVEGGGKATLQTTSGESIICQKIDPVTGTFASDKLASGTLHFLECTASGLKVNSVGDEPGTILVPVLIEICLTKSKELVFGAAVKIGATKEGEEVVIENAGTGLKIRVKNTAIGRILEAAGKKSKVFTIQFSGEKGVQKIDPECVNEKGEVKKHNLLAETTISKKFDPASQALSEEAKIVFEEEVELMDT